MCFCAVAWIRRAPLRALFFVAVEQPAGSQCTELRNHALDVNKPLWLSTRLNLQQEWMFNLLIARGKSVCIDNEMSDSYKICFVKRLLQFEGTVPSHTTVHGVYLQLNRLQLTPGCYSLTTHTCANRQVGSDLVFWWLCRKSEKSLLPGFSSSYKCS